MSTTIKQFVAELEEDLFAQPHSGDIAVLAGDYVLGLDARYTRNYGIYPDSSLEIASRLILQTRAQLQNKIFMFTLINDWKFLAGNPNAHQIRKTYWSNPEFDLKAKLSPELQKHLLPGRGSNAEGVDTSLSLGRYSEQRLHSQYSHLLAKNNQKLISQLFDEIGLVSGNTCESQACSLNQCASEVVMILRNLYQQGIRKVINLMPAECHINIEVGTKIFSEGSRIFLPEFKDPMVVENHYLNSTHPQTEQELFEPHVPQKISRHFVK